MPNKSSLKWPHQAQNSGGSSLIKLSMILTTGTEMWWNHQLFLCLKENCSQQMSVCQHLVEPPQPKIRFWVFVLSFRLFSLFYSFILNNYYHTPQKKPSFCRNVLIRKGLFKMYHKMQTLFQLISGFVKYPWHFLPPSWVPLTQGPNFGCQKASWHCQNWVFLHCQSDIFMKNSNSDTVRKLSDTRNIDPHLNGNKINLRE